MEHTVGANAPKVCYSQSLWCSRLGANGLFCCMQNPIIVALDVAEVPKADRLIGELAPFVGAFKVGSELFTIAGPEMIRRIRATGASVFLDLKFHDIPIRWPKQ